jgi:hypothetical protein
VRLQTTTCGTGPWFAFSMTQKRSDPAVLQHRTSCSPVLTQLTLTIVQLLPTPPKAVMTDAEINAQIDDRLPYRKEWPILPVLPCTNIWKSNQYIDRPAIADIFDELEIILPEGEMNCRYRCSFGVGRSWSTLTLQIQLHIRTNSRWVEAIRKIKRYFIQNDVDIAMIEILDERMCNRIIYGTLVIRA